MPPSSRPSPWLPLLLALALLLPLAATAEEKSDLRPLPTSGKLDLTDEEWRERLSYEVFRIMRLGKTERAFSGAYWRHAEKGIYRCAACGQGLYHSDQKFDSGNGWASFSAPVEADAIETRTKTAFGKTRIELKCSRCGGHVGFAYLDGPAPTGQRHTLNSIALVFEDETTWQQTDAKRRQPLKSTAPLEASADPEPATDRVLDGGSPP